MAQRPPRVRRVVGFAAATLCLFAGAAPASAVYYGGGMRTQSFCVQNPSVNSVWLSAINNGRNAWNSHTLFPGSISTFSGCTSQLQVGSYGKGYLGQYSPGVIGYQFTIRLDSTNLNAHIQAKGYTFANVVKSTTAHEFGHALRLGDNKEGYPQLLMCHCRNRNNITGPTRADVLESNSYYS